MYFERHNGNGRPNSFFCNGFLAGQILAFGDSITASSFSNWFAVAVQQINSSGFKITGGNYAVAGQGQNDSYAIAETQIAAQKPYFATWFPYSVNDGWTAAAIYADYNAHVQDFIDLCHANGVIPVLLTQIPTARINDTPAENARLDVNNMVRALASDDVVVVDMDAVMSDHNSPIADIISTYSDDGTHPNGNAFNVMSPALADGVLDYIASH